MREIIRKRIKFTGLVQGVGFRWRAKNSAAALGLTGWVRNEYDGSVTMEVQGVEAAIDRMLAEISAGRYIDIDQMEARRISIDENERSFKVRGY
ncbi:MAG: acylphosphatase [Eubacterium sp.]|nr:acylphosphatase [Eubacterium sp.]MBR6172884.1 acylphosphatase [Eubacterium sp.]